MIRTDFFFGLSFVWRLSRTLFDVIFFKNCFCLVLKIVFFLTRICSRVRPINLLLPNARTFPLITTNSLRVVIEWFRFFFLLQSLTCCQQLSFQLFSAHSNDGFCIVNSLSKIYLKLIMSSAV